MDSPSPLRIAVPDPAVPDEAVRWTRARLECLDYGRWSLIEPVVYHVGGYPAPDGWLVEVPAGFETDGVTLPGPMGLLFRATWRLRPAALLHDYLLTRKGYRRTVADGVFYEAARATPRCPRILAALAFLVVAVYGLLIDR